MLHEGKGIRGGRKTVVDLSHLRAVLSSPHQLPVPALAGRPRVVHLFAAVAQSWLLRTGTRVLLLLARSAELAQSDAGRFGATSAWLSTDGSRQSSARY